MLKLILAFAAISFATPATVYGFAFLVGLAPSGAYGNQTAHQSSGVLFDTCRDENGNIIVCPGE
jgi:hypothetical protein